MGVLVFLKLIFFSPWVDLIILVSRFVINRALHLKFVHFSYLIWSGFIPFRFHLKYSNPWDQTISVFVRTSLNNWTLTLLSGSWILNKYWSCGPGLLLNKFNPGCCRVKMLLCLTSLYSRNYADARNCLCQVDLSGGLEAKP